MTAEAMFRCRRCLREFPTALTADYHPCGLTQVDHIRPEDRPHLRGQWQVRLQQRLAPHIQRVDDFVFDLGTVAMGAVVVMALVVAAFVGEFDRRGREGKR